MASLSEVLKNLVAQTAEEQSVLQAVLGIAQSFILRGQRDLGLAVAATASSDSHGLPQLLTTLPEESRTHFFGLVEAMEIYQSVHGTAASLLNLNESAVSELRKIRDICLEGGTHAYY